MVHSRSHLAALAFLLASPAWCQVTLEHCQESARANHPMIEQFDLIAKSAEYTISNANKAYLPHVSLTGIGAYIISGLPTLPGSESSAGDDMKFIGIGQVNQTLWDGGTTAAQKDLIAAGAAADSAKLEVDLHRIRERVDHLFFGILVTDAQLDQLDIAAANLQRSLDKLKLSKENGLVLQSDVDEVQAELLKLEQKRIEFTYARSGFVNMLSYIIGETLDRSVELERPATAVDFASAPNQRPELGAFSAQRKVATAQFDLERTALMPKVGLLGAGILITPPVGFGASDMSSLALAGLSLSWNTAGLYRNGNNRKLHDLKLARIASQERSFLYANTLELRQDNEEIEKARAILAADEAIVALKRKIKDAYQLKYDNGMCPMNDLITAINAESEAQSNKALHELQLALGIHRYATHNGN